MILAIDMGNSNIKIGLVRADGTVVEERVTTTLSKTSMEYVTDIVSVLSFYGVDRRKLQGAIISSVVPPLTSILAVAVRKLTDRTPVLVNSGMKMELDLSCFHSPGQVGADLIVAAEGVLEKGMLPAIIVNMGTATTITAVDEKRRLLGGTILPGMQVSLNSLTNSTAQLPAISLDNPGSVISTDTVECMRSGIIYGNAAQLDGIIDRMEKEIGKPCALVATGGMARFTVPYCRHKIELDGGLMMKGLTKLYRLNAQ